MYGFVLGERLNLVMQDEILSVCAVTPNDQIRTFDIMHRDRLIDTHGIHLASFPLLLQGCDFDVT